MLNECGNLVTFARIFLEIIQEEARKCVQLDTRIELAIELMDKVGPESPEVSGLARDAVHDFVKENY